MAVQLHCITFSKVKKTTFLDLKPSLWSPILNMNIADHAEQLLSLTLIYAGFVRPHHNHEKIVGCEVVLLLPSWKEEAVF